MIADDLALAALATDLRHALAASYGRLQLSRRHLDRGNVDIGRIVQDLDDLDASVRRVMDLVIVLEASEPIFVAGDQTVTNTPA